jgi:hypothetical protein
MRPQGISSKIATQLYSGENTDPKTYSEWVHERETLSRMQRDIDLMLSKPILEDDTGKPLCKRSHNERRTILIKNKNNIQNRLTYLKSLRTHYQKNMQEMELLAGRDLHDAILEMLGDLKQRIKNIEFLLHREWTDKKDEGE